ncbi:hypothetical protein O7631_08245 [Micromonospora sp. WMMD967]|uniref:hypothetical protein n=1 Tax=Micromonospora sp. WMMD967 TaxID=3016101 RepID=UPI0024160569|nr:hypothetical protein [Micromonospora sp. WMMD967]MDG4836507.1 hypothetical protein [Micromonospora sp. WMMD967]
MLWALWASSAGAGDEVLSEVVGIELGGLSEGVGEDAWVEATVGALREGEKGVAAG